VSNALLAAEGNGFNAPGPSDFEPPPFFTLAGVEVNKPIVVVLLSAVIVAAFFYAASRRIAPAGHGPRQAAVRRRVGLRLRAQRHRARDDRQGGAALRPGPRHAVLLHRREQHVRHHPAVPAAGTSKIAIPLGLAAIVWVIYNYLGIKRMGFVGYFKAMMFPPGIPWPVYIVLAPIEFLSNVIVRPLTLCLRLTLNMFAGHLVLVLFILGGEYLILEYSGVVGVLAGSVAIFASIVVTFFEAFIQLLQAYVFTLLAALYIGGALVDEH
jgi:F-type H+-transporting ATPase subunit a